MSKRIMYRRKNAEGMAPSERASIVPNAAPVVAKTSMSAGAKLLVILLVVVAVVAIAILALNLVANSFFSKVNTQKPWYEETISVKDSISDMGVYENADLLASAGYAEAYEKVLSSYAEASHALKADENVYNFAVYGTNTFGDVTSSTTAAFIMIASYNNTTKKVTYVTFTEDMLVYIPVVAKVGELRDAYEWGGAALLTKTIQHNFAVAINGYVEINMAVAAELVDNAGGIEVEVADATALNVAIESFNTQFSKTVASATVANGKAKLNGEQALAYSKLGNAETTALVKKLGKAIFQSGIGGMIDAFNVITKNAKTAITKDDFNALARVAMTTLKKADAKTISVGETETVWHQSFKVDACVSYANEITKLDALYN